jgi:serine/threonine-protein kinase MRCK
MFRILKKNKLPDRTVFRCREVLDNTVSVIKNALSACLIDRDRMVVGTDDGLFCIDLDRDGNENKKVNINLAFSNVGIPPAEICRIGDQKKIHQVEYLNDEQLMIALTGKQRQMRLIPVKALDQPDTEWIKVADTKGCIVFATGVMRPNQGGREKLHLLHNCNNNIPNAKLAVLSYLMLFLYSTSCFLNTTYLQAFLL